MQPMPTQQAHLCLHVLQALVHASHPCSIHQPESTATPKPHLPLQALEALIHVRHLALPLLHHARNSAVQLGGLWQVCRGRAGRHECMRSMPALAGGIPSRTTCRQPCKLFDKRLGNWA